MKTRAGILLLLLVGSACGRVEPRALTDAGYTALNESRYADAKASFDEALAVLDPGDPRYSQARLGACHAGAFLDAEAAYADFLAVVEWGTDDYVSMVAYLAAAGALGRAIDLARVGKQRYPDSPKWAAIIDHLVRMAERRGDAPALDALAGVCHGYGGDD